MNTTRQYAGAITDQKEKDAVKAVMDKGWFGLGEKGEEFEHKLASYIGMKGAVLTNSGSSANLLALTSLELPKGSEVITCGLAFPTTVNPIIQCGLVPVFVDCDETLNIDYRQLDKAYSEKTKAVMFAHTLGNPANIEFIVEFCKTNDLYLIEDCCLAGDTRIKTMYGDKKIKDIKVGDCVMTRKGYRKVLKAEKTGEKKVIHRFGITATPDHPFITTQGVVRFDKLSASDIIYIWKERQSYIETIVITDTLIQNYDNVEFTTTDIAELYPFPYIGNSGLTTLVRYLKVRLSITKMKIHSIMKSVISNVFQLKNIQKDILQKNEKQSPEVILNLQGKKLQNGIEVKKELNGIKNKEKKDGRIKRLLQSSVLYVINHIRHILHIVQNSAERYVNKDTIPVYNLKIEGENEFFANGILVHNCDALGSSFQGKMLGSFGNLSTYSFYPAHHISMGEGGAICYRNKLQEKIIRQYRDWGRDCYCRGDEKRNMGSCQARFSFKVDGHEYDHKYITSKIGYNLKPTELEAAIGVEQIKKLKKFVIIRKRNYKRMRKNLSCLSHYLSFPKIYKESDPSWFSFPIIIKTKKFTRREITEYLESKGIQTRLVFAGNITRQPAYKNIIKRVVGSLTNADNVMFNAFMVGVYPGLTLKDVDFISNTIIDYVNSKL